MFKSEKICCFLNGFAGHGDDTESKELKLVFHVNAITPELASEISPQLADRLFRKNIEGEWVPAEEITKAAFSNIVVPMQNIKFYSLPPGEIESGVLVLGCAISNLRAQRPVVEARLEFDVVVPMDSNSMRLVEKYYKGDCFLTMEEIQREIQYAESEDIGLQDAADAVDGKSAGAGEVEAEVVEGKRGRGKKK